MFVSPDYSRSPQDLLLTVLRDLVDRAFAALIQLSRESPYLFWGSAAVVALFFAAVIARGVYLARLHASQAAQRRRSGSVDNDGRWIDPWKRAHELAGAGNYTEAAHMLYRFLLDILMHREGVQLHPAKTVGDYTRELRSRSSQLFPDFRRFARSYEFVVYGAEGCDRARYEGLLELARQVGDERG